ncbi:hypothetical protein OSB04_013784 [Centaurea solstitialis]|uniref:EDR1/CTR1/ARMC3-like peptidase-like domain-containing protein n=1 Tax=Centaurea solstitialis TaxID=347529 RepID=A0AA38TDX5_9ASTR|nr:hypothetical protein OSB04_013784 [Centaurea solstitialis]
MMNHNRQSSSWSSYSYTESSLSGGEYLIPSSFAPTSSGSGVGDDGGGGGDGDGRMVRLELMTEVGGDGGGGGWCSSLKSWAQQTEEGYKLQLALALRLTSEATCTDDPNLLDPVVNESATLRSSMASAEDLSRRFWINEYVELDIVSNSKGYFVSGNWFVLSYFDKIPDGFYVIHGMDPYVWAKYWHLVYYLKNWFCCLHKRSAVAGEDDLVLLWKECSDDLKKRLGSVAIPMGSLLLASCRHRALLFKVLADTIDLPCRIAKGCKYCRRDDASSCLVHFGDREVLVDLVGNPGYLCELTL